MNWYSHFKLSSIRSLSFSKTPATPLTENTNYPPDCTLKGDRFIVRWVVHESHHLHGQKVMSSFSLCTVGSSSCSWAVNSRVLASLVSPSPALQTDLPGWSQSPFNRFFKWNIILLLRMSSGGKLERALISVASGALCCRLVSFLEAEFVLALQLKGFDS